MFNFVGKRNIFFIISALIIVAGIIAYIAFGGFNADIDFTGGYTMTVRVSTTATMTNDAAVNANEDKNASETEDAQDNAILSADENAEAEGDAAANTDEAESENKTAEEPELVKSEVVTSEKTKVKDTFEFNETDVRNALKGIDAIKSLSVVKTDDGFVLKFNELDAQEVSKIKLALADEYGQIRVISEDRVSATVGKELWGNASMALIIAAILMLIYISFRFELLSGLSAVIALLHDLFVMMAVYAIFQLPVNTSFIAAMLTILGYSINATIVIFDRIRENAKFLRKETFAEITNKSIWQSMGRAINTSVTTLLTIVMVYILGVTSVREFALPIIIGIVCGTYSSIFIAGPVWALFKGTEKVTK